jgi:hypothetical protein
LAPKSFGSSRVSAAASLQPDAELNGLVLELYNASRGSERMVDAVADMIDYSYLP